MKRKFRIIENPECIRILNSDTSKEKEKEKKIKEKKSKGKKLRTTYEVQGKMKKNSILSKLDTLDDIMKEESRVVEEKLKSGLIKSEQAEKEEILEKEEITLSKIKEEIGNLQNIKNKYHAEGNSEKAIEISKKIIVLAFSNNLKSIVNEENKFLEIIKNKIVQEPEKLDLQKEHAIVGIIKKETATREAEIQDKSKFDEENLKFKEEKERFEQEKLKYEEKKESLKQERLRFEEEKQTFEREKQMFEEIKKNEKEKNNDLKET